MDVKKSQRVPSFTFFGTVALFKNLILKYFSGNFFMSPKGSSLHFFFIFLQPAGVSKSPKGPPLSILSLRYDADFGHSRLVMFLYNISMGNHVFFFTKAHIHFCFETLKRWILRKFSVEVFIESKSNKRTHFYFLFKFSTKFCSNSEVRISIRPRIRS